MKKVKPMVAIDGKPAGLQTVDDLFVKNDVIVDKGYLDTGAASLPSWKTYQTNRILPEFLLGTTNGTNYTMAGLFGGGAPSSVAWSPKLGIFCAVGGSSSPAAATSPDGLTWTTRATPTSNGVSTVVWAPEIEIFCYICNSGEAATSSNGINWTRRVLPAGINSWASMCWSPKLRLFCAVSASNTYPGGRIITSPDGITWTVRSTGNNAHIFRSVCWSEDLGIFCAVGSSGVSITSSDGVVWTTTSSSLPDFATIPPLALVCWSSALGIFLAAESTVSPAALRILSSANGSSWSLKKTGTPVASIRYMNWVPELRSFIAGGSAPSGSGKIMRSADGGTWTSIARRAGPYQSANLTTSLDSTAFSYSPELGMLISSPYYMSTTTEVIISSSSNAIYHPFCWPTTTASAANLVLSASSVPANQLLKSTSSARYKKDIEDMDGLKIQSATQLRPVSYHSLAGSDNKDELRYGLVAEEVAAVEPRLVDYDNEGRPDGVQYSRLNVFLLGLVKQMQEEIDSLEQELSALMAVKTTLVE